MEINSNDTDYVLSLLVDFSRNNSLFICGAGSYGKILCKWLDLHEIVFKGFVDKNVDKALTEENVYSYESLSCDDVQRGYFILATRFYNNDIKNELLKKNIDSSRIIEFRKISLFDHMAYENNGVDKNRKKWVDTGLKGIHKNERAFFIGNGSSLRMDDLVRLTGEITFATNSIYQVILSRGWQPCYYFIHDRYLTDNVFDDNVFESILKNSGTVFCEAKNSLYSRFADSNYNNLYFYKSQNIDFEDKEKYIPFSEDIVDSLFAFGTTVYDFYQFAAYMGITEIYLVGMDLDFAITINDKGEKRYREGYDDHPDFLEVRKEQQVYNEDAILLAHKTALEYGNTHGIRIFNATRGGKLNIFQRVNLDDILNEC